MVVNHEVQLVASRSARWAMICGRGRAFRPVLVGSVVAAKSVLVASCGLLSAVLLLLLGERLLLGGDVGLGRLERLHLLGVPALVGVRVRMPITRAYMLAWLRPHSSAHWPV